MANPNIASESLSQLLTAMRSLAVRPVARTHRIITAQTRTRRSHPCIPGQGPQESRNLRLRSTVRVWEKRELYRQRHLRCFTEQPGRYRHQTTGTGDERHPHQTDKRYCCSCRRQGNGRQRLVVLHTICCVDIPEPAKYSPCHSPTPSGEE